MSWFDDVVDTGATALKTGAYVVSGVAIQPFYFAGAVGNELLGGDSPYWNVFQAVQGQTAEEPVFADVSPVVENLSTYDAGNQYGDIGPHTPDFWATGGTEGGGGFQLPVSNAHLPDAINELVPDWLKDAGKWVLAGAAALAAIFLLRD